MIVYVQNMDGQPLMPTERCGKVRRMLRDKKAIVIKHCPFTIKLLYKTDDKVQPVSLGIDAGSKTIGVSACTDKKELYAAEITIRNDVKNNISTRREFRRTRRNRKTRYRKPRFLNRVRSKKKGWFAPSIDVKISSHITAVDQIMKILPVSKIIVETASFDIQKMQAEMEDLKKPEGTDYQNGPQLGFWNVREYVLHRDGHKCRCCKGKSGDKILDVHHIESRKTGGNAPDNLVTLCETCHKSFHKGTVKLPADVKRKQSYRDATFMGIMRWAFYGRLKEKYPGMVFMTYGYITKNTRIEHHIEKTHAADARCISGNPDAVPLGYYFMQKKVRCHNRQIHRAKILKGGIRKNSQAAKVIKGFRLFDRVDYHGTECFIVGRRTSGYFDLRLVDGTKIHSSASWKEIKRLEHTGTTLTERRPA